MKPQSASIYRQKKTRARPRRSWSLYVGWTIALCGMTVLLGACSKYHVAHSGGDTTVGVTPTTAPKTVISPTPTPTPKPITLQVVGCPALSINWDQLVGTQANVNKVQKVTCGALQGGGTLDAVVNVRYYSSDAKLDVYVYTNLYGAPARLFSLKGLLNGDAQISPTGLLLTAEVGANDAIKGAPDVFKQFSWNGSSFQQTLFPAIFPDPTYYQAEQSQATLNAAVAAGSGAQNWRKTFFGPPDMLAKSLFGWAQTQITNGTVRYQTSSATYIASVTNNGPGGGGFIATMFHLDSNIDGQIFEIMRVTSLDGTTLLNSPVNAQQITSPVTVSGSATASNGTIGHVVIYSDIFAILGDSQALPGGSASFSKAISYQSNSPGLQEAVVAFYSTNQNSLNVLNQGVMVKVFLS